jgi:citrate synthase
MRLTASTHLSAVEAARRLGISRASLYAYVSRGLVRSERGPDRHRRLYLAEDVDRLVRRKAERKDPARVAAEALRWGAPVLESALTLIQDGRLYYRGYDALTLARTATLEEIAALLWGAADFADVNLPAVPARRVDSAEPLLSFQAQVLALAGADPAAHDLSPSGVRRSGWRTVRALVRLAAGASPRAERAGPLAPTLGRGWGVGREGQDLIRQALVLCADHELNVSTFAVRCVASSRATPYAAVVAGLSAAQGRRHGGAIVDVERLLRRAAQVGARAAVQESLAQEGQVPGFGHPLYPQGDPRARVLLERMGRSAAVKVPRAVGRFVADALGQAPTLDFALAVLTRGLRLPAGAGQMLFALGRTVGWIGHALEAYEADALIRPRARYTGPAPERQKR